MEEKKKDEYVLAEIVDKKKELQQRIQRQK